MTEVIPNSQCHKNYLFDDFSPLSYTDLYLYLYHLYVIYHLSVY